MRKPWMLAALLCAAGAAPGSAGDVPRYSLEELRAVARSRHPTLESARAAVAEARAAGRQARAFADPEARFGAGRAEGEGTSGSERAVELSQVFELPGLRRWRARAADSEVERAERDRLAAEALVDLTVGRLVVETLLARATMEVAGDSESLSRRLADFLERRAELGESPPLEALKATAETYSRRQTAIEARRGLAAARAALDAFCDHALGPRFELAASLAEAPPLPDPAALAERLERGNPLVQAARAAVAAAEAREGLEGRRALPGIEVSVSRESELDKSATGLGVALALPLWNRNRAAVAASRSAVERARADLRALTLELRSALDRAVEEHLAAAETVALYDGGWRDAAIEIVGIAEFSYENGEASLLDLLDAQRSLLAVRLDEAAARARLARTRYEIEHLVGGDLTEETSDDRP